LAHKRFRGYNTGWKHAYAGTHIYDSVNAYSHRSINPMAVSLVWQRDDQSSLIKRWCPRSNDLYQFCTVITYFSTTANHIPC